MLATTANKGIKSMKALVYTGTEEVIYRDEPKPSDPADGDVLLDIDACGLCGSDMHAYHGLDARRVPPLILGHEAVGVVQNGPRSGERVIVNPLISCGKCMDCIAGRSNLCADRELIGMLFRLDPEDPVWAAGSACRDPLWGTADDMAQPAAGSGDAFGEASSAPGPSAGPRRDYNFSYLFLQHFLLLGQVDRCCLCVSPGVFLCSLAHCEVSSGDEE